MVDTLARKRREENAGDYHIRCGRWLPCFPTLHAKGKTQALREPDICPKV